MIFFSGWGIIFVPAMFIVGLIVSFGIAVTTGLDKTPGFLIGGTLASAFCWWAGDRLNNPTDAKTVVDKATGKVVALTRANSLMFIPVQYWAFIIFAAFAFLAFGPPQ